MDTNEFYLKIKIAYNDNNFVKIYDLFKEKLKTKNIRSIDFEIINIYLYTLEMLNKEDEKIEVLKQIYNKKTFYLEELIYIYLKRNDNNSIFNLECDNKENFFLAAIECYKKGDYENSTYWFNEYINNAPDSSKNLIIIKEYMERIKKHNETGCFLSLNFSDFLEKGYTLSVGDIVYVYDNKGLEKKDKKRERRPILIWKIEKSKIYGIPLTTKIKNNKIVISKNKYLNLKKDSSLRNDFLIFDKNKIKNVVERINVEELNDIFYNFYISIICNNKVELENSSDFILDFLKKMDIQKHNIILYRDNNTKLHKKYFILSINHDSYELIEVDKQKEKYIVTNKIPITKNKKKPMLSKLEINEENINEILNSIDERYRIKDKIGIIIETDKKRYVILKELDNEYICAFLPYSNTFALFDRISKDNDIVFKERMDKDELLKLEDMLKKYAGENNTYIEGYSPSTKRISKHLKKQRKI